MNKQVERDINKIYESVFKKVFNKDRMDKLSKGSRIDIELTLGQLSSSEKYEEFARKFSKELAKHGLRGQKGVWKKYFEAAKKFHHIGIPNTYSEFELNNMEAAIQHNFEMIKSIPQRMLEVLNHKYTNTLIEEVAKGKLPRGSFKKELEKHGAKQAQLIARTETAKLQTAIAENRATQLGSVVYEWISSNDKRTRPSHRAMNGVIVFWIPPNGNKPLLDNMRGNAGEFPNCRCDAQAILDIEELTKSNYKIYNYNTDSVISVSKSRLIEIIQNQRI